jgi:hypothetical protein
MHDKFSQRIEQALRRLSARAARSKKPLDPATVNRQCWFSTYETVGSLG